MLNICRFLGAVDTDAAVAPWIRSSFPVISIVIMVILAVLSVAMMILVCMQKSDSNGVSAISGQSDTFYNRNKKSTLQGKIKVLTIVTAVLIMVLCVIFLILNSIYNPWNIE